MNNFGTVVVVVAKAWGGGVVVGSELPNGSPPPNPPAPDELLFDVSAFRDWRLGCYFRQEQDVHVDIVRKTRHSSPSRYLTASTVNTSEEEVKPSPGPLNPTINRQSIASFACRSAVQLATWPLA
jgi:hypothetical protein